MQTELILKTIEKYIILDINWASFTMQILSMCYKKKLLLTDASLIIRRFFFFGWMIIINYNRIRSTVHIGLGKEKKTITSFICRRKWNKYSHVWTECREYNNNPSHDKFDEIEIDIPIISFGTERTPSKTSH